MVLLGPPGAGKGTQAKRIVESRSLVHLSSGDLLRAERSAGTELGKKVASIMDSGQLVSDELVTEVVLGRIREEFERGESGLLLDGFPRTISQAKDLDEALAGLDEKVGKVISLKLADEIVVERLVGRRSCPKCGRVYHIQASAPKRKGVCDACDGELVHRSDDTEEVVRERLDVYVRQTQPLEEYYGQAGLLSEIDANMAIEQVSGEIEKDLDLAFDN